MVLKQVDQNKIKKISSLSHGKYRKLHALFVVEGAHVVEELLKSRWEVQSLIVTYEAAEDKGIIPLIKAAERRRTSVEVIPQKIFSRLSDTESPQGILALAVLPQTNLPQLLTARRILIADGVADPGNLGTMIRTAAAFGFEGFITTPGSVDIFSPKTVRASQGSMFHLEIANQLDYKDIAQQIKPSHKIYTLTAQASIDLETSKPAVKAALVIGAEISGVSPEISALTDLALKIPMSSRVESLNAAVAAGIAMYEFSRRG
jgi:TrmH family RNA methyltransferase